MLFYFPVCRLIPTEGIGDIKIEGVSVVPRRWDISIFDLATLQINHKLSIPYGLLDLYFKTVNFEFCIEDGSFDGATSRFKCLRALLYSYGISPFISPCVMSHSLNQIAGINSRDGSNYTPYEELKTGITSNDTKVEIRPIDLVLKSIARNEQSSFELSKTIFINSAFNLIKLMSRYDSDASIRTLVDGLVSSPKIEIVEQSCLHIWTLLESLFPTVQQEISFRIALYIAQITGGNRMLTFRKIKKLYAVRSKIAHGNVCKVDHNQWLDMWLIVCRVASVVFSRGSVPSEDELIDDLLSRNSSVL